MFDVPSHKVIISGLDEIIANELSLFNDGNNDIIYTGTNKFGNRILGTIVFEDRQDKYLRFFHILITEDTYLAFLNRAKTLRSILEESESFFVVDKDFNDTILRSNLASITDIPEKFLPLSNSYCPTFIYDASLDYVFSLKGGLADAHKAEPEIVNEMNTKFCSFIKSSSSFLNSLDIYPHVYSEPSMTGSFELNFRIELNEQQSLFSRANNSDVKNFILNLYKYIFNQLPNEEIGALKSDNIQSLFFKKMKDEFDLIHKERQRNIDGDREAQLIDIITESVENFKDINYIGFERIEVLNKSNVGNKLPVAIIKENFYNSVENRFYKLEDDNKEDIIIIDEKPVKYSIQVYQLNKNSGNGKVQVTDRNGIVNIPIYIRGRANYQNTIFTKNMDEKEPTLMDVMAIGTRVNGVLKSLVYVYKD